MLRYILIYLITIYKNYVSFLLVFLIGGSCRLTPTCSEYGSCAIERHGIVKGLFLTIKRIFRCNPFTKVSFDPVPLIK